MKYINNLAEDTDGRIWYKGADRTRFEEVSSVLKAAQILKKTRRQIYRYIKTGILRTTGKMLGEWLITQDSINILLSSPLMVQPLPRKTQRYFPEFSIDNLNPGKYRLIVMSRLLEQGDMNDIRWLLKRYGSNEIIRMISQEGERLLSPKALRQWSLFFGISGKLNKSRNRFTNPWDNRKSRLFHYNYPLIRKINIKYKNLPVASEEDIAAMKLSAAIGRGTKKDFIDLFFLGKEIGLEKILKVGTAKFSEHKNFFIQATRALIYFDDAEKDPMPRMLKSANWDEIKTYFEKDVKKLLKKRLNS